eukprot:g8693.t1 g8693   contig33:145-1648(+)
MDEAFTAANAEASYNVGNGIPKPISKVPNSQPKEKEAAAAVSSVPNSQSKPKPAEIIVNGGTCSQYRDFANALPMDMADLPAKLAAILSDPELAGIITWMPHGRSFQVLDRDAFTNRALPRYFGHNNFCSFVRIVNAWGFCRITTGLDIDSYYHELFLRGKPNLHMHMKRVSARDKNKKCYNVPNFYELAKVSPLPEVTFNFNCSVAVGGTMDGSGCTMGMGNNMMLQVVVVDWEGWDQFSNDNNNDMNVSALNANSIASLAQSLKRDNQNVMHQILDFQNQSFSNSDNSSGMSNNVNRTSNMMQLHGDGGRYASYPLCNGSNPLTLDQIAIMLSASYQN